MPASRWRRTRGCHYIGKLEEKIYVAERIGRDRSLQEHWIKRIVAIVVDSIIVGIATTILSIAVFFPRFLRHRLDMQKGHLDTIQLDPFFLSW